MASPPGRRGSQGFPAILASQHVVCCGLSRDGGSDMTAVHHPTDFTCPGCGHRLIHCKVCKRTLAATDREYILKYFLISRKQAAKKHV
jgi:predicted RNA-binding Zn-ribbon protein involved in translation (DUF1610 family)